MQANVGHLWCIRCNGILEKQKYERQKAILEVPTQLFGIWRKNMKHRHCRLPSGIYNFIYGN